MRLEEIKQKKSSWGSAMNNTFLLLYSPKLQRQVWILVYQKWSIARCDVSWSLWACYKQRRLWYFRLSFSFWYVFDRFRPSTVKRYVWVFVLIHSNRCFSMKTLRVSVWTEGKNKRSEMYVLSNETHYCGQGQKVIRISLFQAPRCNVRIS